MAIPYPDILLIGNIHWIADKNYIIQTSPESSLLHGQLLDFQVTHICQHLHIPTNNVFDIPIPRNHLLKEIKDKMKSTPFNPSIDCLECAQYGLVCHIKDENRYTFRNIGGKPLIEFKLNTSQTELDSIGQSIPYDLTHPSNDEIVPFILPKNHFESLIGTPPHPLRGGGSGGSGSSIDIQKKRDKKHHTSKRRISDMYRQNSTDTIDLYGKIDDDHHTYPGTLNTTLMFLIYHMKPKIVQDDELWDIIEYYQHRLLTLHKNAKINKFMAYYNRMYINYETPFQLLTILCQRLQPGRFSIVDTPRKKNTHKLIGIILKDREKYTLFMKIRDILWVYYDGSYDINIQNDYFVEIGSFQDVLSYRNGIYEKYKNTFIYE
jgi:hypothetical protein